MGLVEIPKAPDILKVNNMKRYLSDFNLNIEFVRNCVYDCLNGSSTSSSRWHRYDTAFFLSNYLQEYLKDSNAKIDTSINIKDEIHNILIKDKEKLFPLIDYISKCIYKEIKTRTISLDVIDYKMQYDKMAKKYREIGISSIKQQCYDYIVVNACKQMFLAKIGQYQCASIKNRGQEYGKSAIETWIRSNPKSCKWIFKADVKKFYPSVPHDILKKHIRRDIKNEDIYYIVCFLIDTYKEGLCIGSYLCQFLANYYLSYAYHYVSEQLFTYRRDKRINFINHILFYMDDIILLGANKKYVKKAAMLLEKYLNEELKLTLKDSKQLFPLDSRPIDMMGYKIYTFKTTVRKRIFKNANKIFTRLKGRDNMSLQDAYKVISYYGYFKNSSSKKYINKMKIANTLKIAKEVISNEAKSNI